MKSPERVLIGRGLLALTTTVGVTGLGMVVENNALADDSPKPCVEVGFTPDTIRNNGTDTTTFELVVLDACRPGFLKATATLDFNFSIEGRDLPRNAEIELKDDGLGEDKRAGDWIFTLGKIYLDYSGPFTYPYQGIPDLVVTKPLNLELSNTDGSTKIITTPDMFILEKNAPLIYPKLRSESIQTTPHVINMRDEFSAVAQYIRGINGEQDIRSLVNRLYGLDPNSDPYHFLVMTNDKQIYVTPHDSTLNITGGLNRSLRSDFTGTGGGGYYDVDTSRLFGSEGNLRHIVFVSENNLFYNIFHELDHWVAAFLPLLIDGGNWGHWLVNMSQGGMVGGSSWVDNGDGTFTSLGYSSRFLKLSKLEQYLWGWIPPELVPPTYVALDENQNFGIEGTKIHGPFKVVTIEDIIAQHGLRTPGPDLALRDLKLGYVYTTTGRLATPIEMTARELLAQRLPILWQTATEGQSTMEFVVPKEAPKILEAYNGRILDGLTNRVKFQPLPDTKWVHLQLIPANNDGPGVNLVIGDPSIIQKGEFSVPAPIFGQGPYIMLPGMSYTWRVRVSDQSEQPDPIKDQGWSGWAQDKFRTPQPSSAIIEPVAPLQWRDRNRAMFYYEVQVSKDPLFRTEADATAAVYWNLVHGAMSNPPNSYSFPEDYQPEPGHYFWRVRPRVQGDGTPVDWSQNWEFEVEGQPQSLSLSTENIDWEQFTKDHWNSIIRSVTEGVNSPMRIVFKSKKPDVVVKGDSAITVIFNPPTARYIDFTTPNL
ncbi:hypothetical protein HYT18_00440 [Candidatus Microgenomates bacterium]|nr:hypothetical protein [Candidatus Microgenomates bacterium]